MDEDEHEPKGLEDCAVAVVGGTGRVGTEIARQFLAAGVRRIGLVGRDAERGRSATDAVAGLAPDATVVFCAADVNDPAQAVRAVDELRAGLGGLDVLVNGTNGPYGPTLLHEIPIDDLQRTVDQQMMGPLNMSRAALPTMRAQRGGAIVNIASDAAKHATPGETAIGAAMAAIVMFSRAMAMEAKRDGIRVNAVTPSIIAGTGGYDRIMDDPFAQKLFRKAIGMASLGVAEPADVAALVVFLSGPGAARITGQAVSPNGGISAG